MARRLGDVLVEQRVVSPEQLREALRSQLLRGGQLGTCLIELGFVDEDRLGAALAEIHGVEQATAAELDSVSREVLALVPRQVVERRRVVPLGVHDNALHLAMANPGDLIAIEEVQFATDTNVKPHVAPEVRIVKAMERHYGIARSARFLRIGAARAEALRSARAAAPQGAREPEGPPAATGWDAIPTIPLAGQTGIPASDHAVRHPTGNPVAPPAPRAPGGIPIGPAAGVDPATDANEGGPAGFGEDAFGEVLRDLFYRVPSDQARGALASRTSAVSEAGLRRDLEQLPAALVEATTPAAVARLVLDCAARGMSRCLLFAVRERQARIWDWRGVALAPAKVSSLRVPVEASGILELVAGSEWYRGPVPQQPSQIEFYKTLGLAVPTEALILPIHFEDRLAAFLYGDGGDLGHVVGKTDLYLRLAQKMGTALAILALRHRLQQI
jgi:hypothetical protein